MDIIYVKLTLHYIIRNGDYGSNMKNNLEKLRKEKGIKQEELALAMEVSRQTISSLESGKYNPSILLAFKLAKFFEMSIEEIFIFEED